MLALGLWSALAVFSELALVRMYTTLVGGVSYFGNLFLLVGTFAAACGLMAPGLGRHARWVGVFLLPPLAVAILLGRYDLVEVMPGEFFWSTFARVKPRAATFDLTLGIVLLALVLVPALVLMGAAQGAKLREVHGGARAYLVFAAGGLAGAGAFALQNQLAPSLLALLVTWCSLIVACLGFESGTPLRKLVWLLPLGVALAVAWPVSHRSQFSPYQRIDLVEAPGGLAMLSNGFYISTVSTVPASKLDAPLTSPTAWAFKSMKPGDRVLVMGSGGGTADVREALRAGAGHVTAVEIDPVFIQMGLRFDPDQTYRNPKVEVVNTDGRHFLASTARTFDLVFYPFVDSQTNASNHARFRLDSFLYTFEGLHLAFEHVAPGGILIVEFATATPWIRYRMYDLLRMATGGEVALFERGPWALYAASKGRTLADVSAFFQPAPIPSKSLTSQIPTDDWPFFYSFDRRVPEQYLLIVGIVAALFGVLLVTVTSRRLGAATPRAAHEVPGLGATRSLLVYAFYSGAAFFFLELRTISALVPVFGSTYLSQALSVIGIVACSLLGALSAQRVRWLPPLLAWVLLFGSVLVSSVAPDWFHPHWGTLLPGSHWLLLALLSPVFFAGYLYLGYVSELDTTSIAAMQKWNLVGGAVGGLAECAVIVVGFRFSAWIALFFYLAAFVAVLTVNGARSRATTEPASS